jgi:hypothetical protein
MRWLVVGIHGHWALCLSDSFGAWEDQVICMIVAFGITHSFVARPNVWRDWPLSSGHVDGGGATQSVAAAVHLDPLPGSRVTFRGLCNRDELSIRGIWWFHHL